MLFCLAGLTWPAGGWSATPNLWKVEWCPEDDLKADSGDILSVCALVTNTSGSIQRFRVHFDYPFDWRILTKEDGEVEIAPGGSYLCLAAIHIARDCSAGLYPIQIRIVAEGEDVGSDTLEIPIRERPEVTVQVSSCPPLVAAGVPYEFEVQWTNTGNVAFPVSLEVRGYPEADCEVTEEEVEAGVGRAILFVTPRRHGCESFEQLVSVKILNADTKELLWEKTSVTEVLPQVPCMPRPGLRLPSWVGVFAGQEHNKQIVGIEMTGGGFIDSDQNRWIDYTVVLPSKDRSGVYNKIQVLYAAAGEADWTAEIGDATYCLSPLTERWRYGRGARAFKLWDQFEAGGLFVAHRDGDPVGNEETGGYLLWRPRPNLFVCGNLLHKGRTDVYPKADICSLQVCHAPWPGCIAEAEFARDYGTGEEGSCRNAYRFVFTGQLPDEGASLCFEKLWAGPKYYGYYNNVDLTALNLEGPLTCRLRGSLCATRYLQNLGPSSNYLSSLPDNRFYQGQLVYRLCPAVRVSLAGRYLRLRDRQTSPCFNLSQEWMDSLVFYTEPGLVVTASASLGRQHDFLLNLVTFPLQVYSLSGCWNRSPCLDLSLIAETGNIEYYDVRKWRSAFGAGCRYRFSPATWFDFRANLSVNMPELCVYRHVCASLGHAFPNRHRVSVNTQYYACRKAAEPYEFLAFVSYDIPFDLLIPQQPVTGCVCGAVFDVATQGPVENAVVSVCGQRTLTDACGTFLFPEVCPGCYEVCATILPPNYTTVTGSGSIVTVLKGKSSHVDIAVVQVGRIEGRLVRYDVIDTLEAAEAFYLSAEGSLGPDCPFLNEDGGLADVLITLAHNDGRSKISYRTSPFGYFRFDRLRPGRWTLSVEVSEIPSTHELIQRTVEVLLQPGQTEQIEMIAIPQRGQRLFR